MKTSLSKTTATDTPKKLLGAGEADAYPFQRQQLPAFMRHEDSVVIGHPMPVIAPAAQYSSAHEVHSRREEVDHDSPSGYQAPQGMTFQIPSSDTSPRRDTASWRAHTSASLSHFYGSWGN